MAEISDHNVTVKRINSDLASSKTRDRGITALQAYLTQCPDETFYTNCVNWMSHCCKTVDGNPKSAITACQTLRELLLTSTKFLELKKSVSSFISSRFFEYFLKYLSDSEDGWFCVEACFTSYKGACVSYEAKLKEVLQELLNKNVKVSKIIADCYALLPSIRGGGHGGVNYKLSWKTQFNQTIQWSHMVLNQLFSGLIEIQTYENGDKVQVENISHEHLSAMFHNSCLILGSMLKNKYPVLKQIPVDSILNLICRGLAVTPKTLGNQLTSNIIQLKNIIPQIHINLYSLLSALIVTCKTNLYPYAHLICKLFKQSFEWTESDYKYGTEKPYASLRVGVYSALSNWIVAGKSGCCAEMISSAVIYAFKKDFIPQKPSLLLQGTEKAKEAKQNEKLQINRVNERANAKLCFSALRTMQLYIKYIGSSLKREEHSELQNAVVRELMEIQCSPSPSDISIPYSVPSCRLELYGMLLAITVTPHAHFPPPTQFSLRIFSQGLNDKVPQISKFCASALNDITNIIHPSFKVATFPVSFDNMKVTTTVEFPKANEKSVDLVWREARTEKESLDVEEVDDASLDMEEPMEVDESVANNSVTTPEGYKEKDLIEFSMVEINVLKESLSSPKRLTPLKGQVRVSPRGTPEKQEKSLQKGESETVQESPKKKSEEKLESPKLRRSPEKQSPKKQAEEKEGTPKKLNTVEELEKSPRKASPEKQGSPKVLSPVVDLTEKNDSPKKLSPIIEAKESPKKASPEKKVTPVKGSPNKQAEEKLESPKKSSPFEQQIETSVPETPKSLESGTAVETIEIFDSPKEVNVEEKSAENVNTSKPESPEKKSPAKSENTEDSENVILQNERSPVIEEINKKRGFPTSGITDSPVRRSTRFIEKSKSDTESPKGSPSPKRRKEDTIPNEGESSSQESEVNVVDPPEKGTDSDNKSEGVKDFVIKIRKLSESVVDADKSVSEEKKYNLRSKPAAKLAEEGKASTPRRGRPPTRSGTKSERSSSSESGTGRTSRRKAEKPKEDDILELFDESLNPQD